MDTANAALCMDKDMKMQAATELMSKLSEAECSAAQRGWITEDEAKERLGLR